MHLARTVCRRAERKLLAASRVDLLGGWPLEYVNRLSDAFFVLGRVAKHTGEKEALWERALEGHRHLRVRHVDSPEGASTPSRIEAGSRPSF